MRDKFMEEIFKIHPSATELQLGDLIFITETLNGEDYEEISYTFYSERDEMKINIGSHVKLIVLGQYQLDNLRSLIFREGSSAGLSTQYLQYLIGGR